MDADFGGFAQHHTLRLHLHQAAVDEVLLHLEVGDAIAEQPAHPVILLEQCYAVPRARQLLCAGHACGA